MVFGHLAVSYRGTLDAAAVQPNHLISRMFFI
jgi:hypothetical protein